MTSSDKFSPDCYLAECNMKTGMCETRLKCDLYSTCGEAGKDNNCRCVNNKCQCDKRPDQMEGCTANQICDYTTNPNGECRNSNCKVDLKTQGCSVMKCNETIGEVYTEEMNCDSLNVEYLKFKVGDVNMDSRVFCEDKYAKVCQQGKCVLKAQTATLSDSCGSCTMRKEGDKYIVEYLETCSSKKGPCGSQGECIFSSDGKAERCDYPELKDPEGKLTEEQYTQEYCKKCLKLKCANSYSYEYQSGSDTCTSSLLDDVPQCRVCENGKDEFTDALTLQPKLVKEYTMPGGEKKEYSIPYVCSAGHIIPDPDYKCSCNENNQYRKYKYGDSEEIIDNLEAVCTKFGDCPTTDKYHYSNQFDTLRYIIETEQTQTFYKEADKEAYCEYTLEEKQCKECEFSKDTGKENYVYENQCPAIQNGVPYVCKNNQCTVDESYKCLPQKCVVQKLICPQDSTDSEACVCDKATYEQEAAAKVGKREGQEVNLCDDYLYKLDTKRKQAIEAEGSGFNKYKYTGGKILECAHYECASNGKKCELSKEDDDFCNQTSEKDYGCRKLTGICNGTNYMCEFIQLKNNPEDDLPIYRLRDGVDLDNHCVTYVCEEETNSNGELKHHWKIAT